MNFVEEIIDLFVACQFKGYDHDAAISYVAEVFKLDFDYVQRIIDTNM